MTIVSAEAKARRNVYLKAYRERNREATREKANDVRKRYKAKHPDKYKEQARISSQRAYWGWEGQNPNRITNQDRHFRLKYGITLAQRNEMIAEQGGCAVCGTNEVPEGRRGWAVDHDHTSGFVRGVLCNGCNVAIGHARDSATVLRAMADYLDAARTADPYYGRPANEDHSAFLEAAE